MTTTRTCVPEFVIQWMEIYKQNRDWPDNPFDRKPEDEFGHLPAEHSDFEKMFCKVTGFDRFHPRCKMAYNHPDMRQILEM